MKLHTRKWLTILCLGCFGIPLLDHTWATDDVSVVVGEDPLIFSDGFETGDLSAWSGYPQPSVCGDSTDPAPDQDVDPEEVCDEGLQICADGFTSCTQHSDCPAVSSPPQICLPANGDACNTTCSSTNLADTFFETGNGTVSLYADTTYLWMTNDFTGEVRRLDINGCISHHSSTATPCVDTTAGTPGCPDPCTAELVTKLVSPIDPINNIMAPSSITSDGSTVWFGARGGDLCQGSITEAYIYAMDIAACDLALAGGAPHCSGLEQIVAGSGTGHVDGIGPVAELGSFRGLTFHNGYVYFLDAMCGTLRRFDPGTSEVATIVGDPTCNWTPAVQEGFGGVHPSAGGACLLSPRFMVSDDSAVLYVSDNLDHTILLYNVSTNYLERFAGDPVAGSGYLDHWDSDLARFDRPRGLTIDGTSLFVADADNYTIRQVDTQNGRVTTMVGVPAPGASPSAKCDLLFGQGAAPGVGSQFHKPLEIAYHQPSGSLFVFTGGGGDSLCGFPTGCGSQINNQVWRVR